MRTKPQERWLVIEPNENLFSGEQRRRLWINKKFACSKTKLFDDSCMVVVCTDFTVFIQHVYGSLWR